MRQQDSKSTAKQKTVSDDFFSRPPDRNKFDNACLYALPKNIII